MDYKAGSMNEDAKRYVLTLSGSQKTRDVLLDGKWAVASMKQRWGQAFLSTWT